MLCAGIIAPRKNQLALAKALKGTGLKLILVGRVQSESYFDAVKNASDGNLCYIGALDQKPTCFGICGSKGTRPAELA